MVKDNPEWQDMDNIPANIEPLDVLIELAHVNRINIEPVFRYAQFAKAIIQQQGYDKATIDKLIEDTLLYLEIVLEFGDKVRPYIDNQLDNAEKGE